MTSKYIVGFVFARGGSKGLPKKNIRPLAGKPLLAHSIEIARRSQFIERIFVSTDSPEIAAIGCAWGAEVPFIRPAELASDTAPEWLAWRHGIREVEQRFGRRVDILVSLPTTAPLRTVEDVDGAIERMLSTSADIVITVTESVRSPFFNMVLLDESQRARLVLPSAKPFVRRQDAPRTYDITPVAYVVRRDYLFSADSIFAGNVQAVTVPNDRALDIDTELDFQIAEHLARQQATAALGRRKAS
jgi:N-acylneuraminate cytidylyltransferase